MRKPNIDTELGYPTTGQGHGASCVLASINKISECITDSAALWKYELLQLGQELQGRLSIVQLEPFGSNERISDEPVADTKGLHIVERPKKFVSLGAVDLIVLLG